MEKGNSLSEDIRNTKHKLKKDAFSKMRGGTSQFLNLFCANCQTWLLLYQKDGHGALLRLYFDRIHAPKNLTELRYHYTIHTVNDIPLLKCPSCNTFIAVAMIYDGEKRLAYRLIHGTFSKKKSGGIIPSSSPLP